MTARTTKPRRDVEQEVTDRMMAALESGTIPWRKPWTVAGFAHTSVATGKPYRGMNVWLLALTSMERGYVSPFWLTFKQAQDHGGTVRKGEKGTQVLFWKMLDVQDRDRPTNDDGSKRTKRIPLVRGYTVFNLEQCDDVKMPPRFTISDEGREPVAVPDAMREVLDGYVNGPSVRFVTQDSAHYDPAADCITLPTLDQFGTSAGFVATALHELTHSTGHPSRLDREQRNHFGTDLYAREELVAEMGSAMLAASAGLDTDFDQSAAYVKNWLGALRDDKSLVIVAAQRAQKAVDRILGTEVAGTAAEPAAEPTAA